MLSNKNKDKEIFRNTVKANNDSIAKIENYIEILDIYQEKLNLIGKTTRLRIWNRHILDSAQIEKYLHAENKKNIEVIELCSTTLWFYTH